MKSDDLKKAGKKKDKDSWMHEVLCFGIFHFSELYPLEKRLADWLWGQEIWWRRLGWAECHVIFSTQLVSTLFILVAALFHNQPSGLLPWVASCGISYWHSTQKIHNTCKKICQSSVLATWFAFPDSRKLLYIYIYVFFSKASHYRSRTQNVISQAQKMLEKKKQCHGLRRCWCPASTLVVVVVVVVDDLGAP